MTKTSKVRSVEILACDAGELIAVEILRRQLANDLAMISELFSATMIVAG